MGMKVSPAEVRNAADIERVLSDFGPHGGGPRSEQLLPGSDLVNNYVDLIPRHKGLFNKPD